MRRGVSDSAYGKKKETTDFADFADFKIKNLRNLRMKLLYYAGGDHQGEGGDEPVDEPRVEEGARAPGDEAEGRTAEDGAQRLDLRLAQVHEGKRHRLEQNSRPGPRARANPNSTSPRQMNSQPNNSTPLSKVSRVSVVVTLAS